MVKISGQNFEKYFQMEQYIQGVRGVIFCIKLLLHHKTFKMKSMVLVNSIPYCEKMAKNGQFHEGRKVRRLVRLAPNFFPVDSFDLKFMSLKFHNNIFIAFEMPMIFWKK
jgi:hypothetical protein